jgi:hypothetical protein
VKDFSGVTFSFYQDSRIRDTLQRLTSHWYGVMAYDRSQTILFTSKMANYDMGLVSNVPSDGSFIYYSLGKLLHGNLGKGVFEFFFFLFFFLSSGSVQRRGH